MNRSPIIRLVAFLLVPCLIADPVTASALTEAERPAGLRSLERPLPNTELFLQEALSIHLAGGNFTGPANAGIRAGRPHHDVVDLFYVFLNKKRVLSVWYQGFATPRFAEDERIRRPSEPRSVPPDIDAEIKKAYGFHDDFAARPLDKNSIELAVYVNTLRDGKNPVQKPLIPEAIQILREALKGDPSYSTFWAILSQCYLDATKVLPSEFAAAARQLAVNCAEQAERLNWHNTYSHRMLGHAYESTQQYARAIEQVEIELSLRMNPFAQESGIAGNKDGLFKTLSMLYPLEGQYRELDAQILTNVQPSSRGALLTSAEGDLAARQYSTALLKAHLVLQNHTNDVDALNLSCRAFLELRQPSAARPYAERLAQLAPYDAVAQNLASEIFWRTAASNSNLLAQSTLFTAAFNYAVAAQKLDPENTAANKNIEEIQLRRGGERPFNPSTQPRKPSAVIRNNRSFDLAEPAPDTGHALARSVPNVPENISGISKVLSGARRLPPRDPRKRFMEISFGDRDKKEQQRYTDKLLSIGENTAAADPAAQHLLQRLRTKFPETFGRASDPEPEWLTEFLTRVLQGRIPWVGTKFFKKRAPVVFERRIVSDDPTNTPEEVGSELGVTRLRVSRIEAELLRQLKDYAILAELLSATTELEKLWKPLGLSEGTFRILEGAGIVTISDLFKHIRMNDLPSALSTLDGMKDLVQAIDHLSLFTAIPTADPLEAMSVNSRDLDLSPRARNALLSGPHHGDSPVLTVRQLVDTKQEDLAKRTGIGIKTVAEIREKVARFMKKMGADPSAQDSSSPAAAPPDQATGIDPLTRSPASENRQEPNTPDEKHYTGSQAAIVNRARRAIQVHLPASMKEGGNVQIISGPQSVAYRDSPTDLMELWHFSQSKNLMVSVGLHDPGKDRWTIISPKADGSQTMQEFEQQLADLIIPAQKDAKLSADPANAPVGADTIPEHLEALSARIRDLGDVAQSAGIDSISGLWQPFGTIWPVEWVLLAAINQPDKVLESLNFADRVIDQIGEVFAPLLPDGMPSFLLKKIEAWRQAGDTRGFDDAVFESLQNVIRSGQIKVYAAWISDMLTEVRAIQQVIRNLKAQVESIEPRSSLHKQGSATVRGTGPYSQAHHNSLSRSLIKRVAGVNIPMTPDALPNEELHALQPAVRFVSMKEWVAQIVHLVAREPVRESVLLLGAGLDRDLPILELALTYRRVVLLDINRDGLLGVQARLLLELLKINVPQWLATQIADRIEFVNQDFSPHLSAFGREVGLHIGMQRSVGRALDVIEEQLEGYGGRDLSVFIQERFQVIISSLFSSQLVLGPIARVYTELIKWFRVVSDADWARYLALHERAWELFIPHHVRQFSNLLQKGGSLYWADTFEEMQAGDNRVMIPLTAFLRQMKTRFEAYALGRWNWVHQRDLISPGAVKTQSIAAYHFIETSPVPPRQRQGEFSKRIPGKGPRMPPDAGPAYHSRELSGAA